MPDRLVNVQSEIDRQMPESVGRLQELLRIPSVSTDSAYDAETRRAAQWCADQLTAIGFDASVRDTTGHPMVVAHHKGNREGAPRLLYYGHYDVQPPDPIDLWNSPPFEPTIVEAEHGPRIVARGAVDDKGQLMMFVEAFRAWKKINGDFPATITVLLEGEEESGSPSLEPFLEANKEELKADVCIVSDTGMWDIETPAITYMLRGMVYVELTLHGPSHDLHSGMYGGGVVNPINALTKILGQLKDDDNRIQIPGFYDDVLELTENEAAQWNSLGYGEKEFLAGAGLKTPHGEKGRTILERLWARPTCDINGIWGGYTGEGAKTVIPAKASAKLSCRLVPNQDPKKIFEGIKSFFESRLPPDCRIDFKRFGCDPAIRVPVESPYLTAAIEAMNGVFEKETLLIGCGGSIPLVGSIQRILGFDSLLMGFGLEDDRIHSPNEKFEVKCYEMGIRSHAALLDRMAEME